MYNFDFIEIHFYILEILFLFVFFDKTLLSNKFKLGVAIMFVARAPINLALNKAP